MAAVIRERTDPGHASEMDGPKVIYGALDHLADKNNAKKIQLYFSNRLKQLQANSDLRGGLA